MMSQSTNLTRLKAQKDIALLIQQWPNFNESVYLRGQLGIEADSFIEYLGSKTTFRVWETDIKPGYLPNTRVEPYRSKRYNNINFGKIEGNGTLNAYLFSLHKNGVEWEINNPDVYDASTVYGSSIVDVSSSYWYSPTVLFNTSQFVNSQINLWYSYQAVIHNCEFKNFQTFLCDFNDSEGRLIRWISNNMNDCRFVAANFSNINQTGSVVDNCKFISCKFHMKAEVDLPTMFNATNCKFQYCIGRFRVDQNSGAFNQNDCTSNVFEEGSVFGGYVHDNDFSMSTFHGVTFDWYLHNSNFMNVNFMSKPIFGPNSVIKGCNYTDSNIDDYYTRDQLKNAVVSYDERTIWVDGTPL